MYIERCWIIACPIGGIHNFYLIHPINKLGVPLFRPKYHRIKIIVQFAMPSQVYSLGY